MVKKSKQRKQTRGMEKCIYYCGESIAGVGNEKASLPNSSISSCHTFDKLWCCCSSSSNISITSHLGYQKAKQNSIFLSYELFLGKFFEEYLSEKSWFSFHPLSSYTKKKSPKDIKKQKKSLTKFCESFLKRKFYI